jgi:hypothetical protein
MECEDKWVSIFILFVLLYVLSTTKQVESFVSTDEVFSKDSQEALQEKYQDYTYAKDNPNSLMRVDSSGPIDYNQGMPEEKKQDCSSACAWKMDNFCTTSDANGKLTHDSKCNDMEYTDQFGMTHKSKGYICSAYGKSFDDGTIFEECNLKKCKKGTITGCDVNKLSELTKDVSKLSMADVSGAIESFQGCPKQNGIFAPNETLGMDGKYRPFSDLNVRQQFTG